MIAVICAAALVISILSAAVFNCSLLFSIAASVVSAALLVVELFLFKGSRLKSVLVFAAAFVVMFVCVFTPPRATEYGLLDNDNLYEKYFDAVYNDKKDKADQYYTQLTEKYGESDETKYVRICSLVASGNIGEAESVVSSFSNQASPFYLMSQEDIINQKYASADEIGENLIQLYIESSDKNPDWYYPAKNAGGLLFDRGEYDKAEYYLSRAMLYCDEDDPEIYYYLGAALCEQGQYDRGLPLLNTAYELGADDKLLGNIAYYVELSGKGEKTNE